MAKVKITFMAVMLALFVSLLMLGCQQQEEQTYGYGPDFYAAMFKANTDFNEPRQNIEEIRESNDPNSKIIGFRIGSRYSIRHSDIGTAPLRIGLNKSFNSKNFPRVKIKLLKIDMKNNRCLIKYESKTDSNTANPQWYKKNDAIFPSIFGEMGVTLLDINKKEIYISIYLGGITRYEKKDE